MHAYVHVCMYACIGACVYVCICTYVCLCISTHIHFIHARVGVHMHSCRRIVFICTFQSLYYMRVYHRCFLTPACVCVRGLEVGFPLAFLAGVRLYFGRGRDRGFVLYISLYLRVIGW